jgi:hypothetical protein
MVKKRIEMCWCAASSFHHKCTIDNNNTIKALLTGDCGNTVSTADSELN